MARQRGLGGAAVRELEHEGLTAVYSRHRQLRVRPSADLVLAHERVVESAMSRGTVLPLRFGTQFDRESDLLTALAERRAELVQSLDRVRGRVEIGLRVLPAAPPTGGPASVSVAPGGAPTGREYLLGRLGERRAGQHATRDLHRPLASLAQASVVRRPRSPVLLVASYLVAVDDAPEFRRRAEELAGALAGVRVHVTGPWPPYSFVTKAAR
jgi:hypothetical protein